MSANYAIVDTHTGFLWETVRGACSPVEACRAIDAAISPARRRYTDHGSCAAACGRSGYLVYRIPVGRFPESETWAAEDAAEVEIVCGDPETFVEVVSVDD